MTAISCNRDARLKSELNAMSRELLLTWQRPSIISTTFSPSVGRPQSVWRFCFTTGFLTPGDLTGHRQLRGVPNLPNWPVVTVLCRLRLSNIPPDWTPWVQRAVITRLKNGAICDWNASTLHGTLLVGCRLYSQVGEISATQFRLSRTVSLR